MICHSTSALVNFGIRLNMMEHTRLAKSYSFTKSFTIMIGVIAFKLLIVLQRYSQRYKKMAWRGSVFWCLDDCLNNLKASVKKKEPKPAAKRTETKPPSQV